MREFPRYVWLNGRVVETRRAAVSVFDRGLLYGDGLFETVRAYRGRVFAWPEHLGRLQRSAIALGFRLPRLEWVSGMQRLLVANRLDERDASVRVTVTRGTAPPGLVPPARLSPFVFAFALPVPPSLARNQRRGVAVISVPFARARPFGAYKLLDYVPAILARRQAAKVRAQEAIYVDNGLVTEATTANVFFVKNRTLMTPALDGLLPGVTRQVVLQLAREVGIATVETSIRIDEVGDADEMFLTSSVVEVLPVVRFDGKPVGKGRPGEVTRALQHAYRQFVDQSV